MKLSGRGIATAIARRNTEHGSGLGIFRYVVEQALALFHQFRRLRTRFDRRDDIHEAFMSLGCSMICWRRLHSSTGHFRSSKFQNMKTNFIQMVFTPLMFVMNPECRIHLIKIYIFLLTWLCTFG